MDFFGTPKRTSVALIDIGSASVGGAFVHFEPKENPTIYFTARAHIERRKGCSATEDMLRALHELSHLMVKEGGPVLRKETGSGHVDSVLVSLAAPWQETGIRVESIENPKPFLFTKALAHEVVSKGKTNKPGRIDLGEQVVATFLNGYEVPTPFGKRVTRAELVILSSTIEESAAKEAEALLRKTFHNHNVEFTAFAPLAYAVFRDLFPHERDYLILDVTGDATDIAFIKHGLLTDIASIEHGTHSLIKENDPDKLMRRIKVVDGDVPAPHPVELPEPLAEPETVPHIEDAWLTAFMEVLKRFSTRHALPRTLFLLCDSHTRGVLAKLLNRPEIHTLWLSDEPLTVIPVSPLHLSEHVRTRGEAEGDVFLAIMSLYRDKSLVPLSHARVIPTIS